MANRRLPASFAPNELTELLERKRREGARILDLTETNPTRVGLGGVGPDELQWLADPRDAIYEPDPRGALAAREAVARYCAGRAGVSAGDIVLTSSTSEAYAHLFRLLCEPGDEIVVPRPSYPLFEPLAALEDVRVEHYRLSFHDRWSLDLDSLEGAISPRTRAVVLVQPNNPTGSCLSASETEAVVSLCAERGIAILSDEVFGDFPWPSAKGPLPSLLGTSGALTFVLSGLSKVCGMPQMKAAWIVTQGPEAGKRESLRRLEWIADLFLSVSTPVQVALPRFLASRGPFQESVRKRLETNLARLASLEASGAGFRFLRGQGGWSAVLQTPSGSPDLAMEALARADVLLHPGHFYDIAPEGAVVVSLLTEPAILEEGLGRIRRLVSAPQNSAGIGPTPV
jgi:aspartate/methionine/tyrosine aminotransferase